MALSVDNVKVSMGVAIAELIVWALLVLNAPRLVGDSPPHEYYPVSTRWPGWYTDSMFLLFLSTSIVGVVCLLDGALRGSVNSLVAWIIISVCWITEVVAHLLVLLLDDDASVSDVIAAIFFVVFKVCGLAVVFAARGELGGGQLAIDNSAEAGTSTQLVSADHFKRDHATPLTSYVKSTPAPSNYRSTKYTPPYRSAFTSQPINSGGRVVNVEKVSTWYPK